MARALPTAQASRIVGGNSATGRRAQDYYPTPPEVLTALLNHWHVGGERVWEPMAGDGSLVEALRSRGYEVVAGDVVDRGAREVILNPDTIQITDTATGEVTTARVWDVTHLTPAEFAAFLDQQLEVR